jgi:hypothetical protein
MALLFLLALLTRPALLYKLVIFWVISGLQLLALTKTLPHDQDMMAKELELYAKLAIANKESSGDDCYIVEDKQLLIDTSESSFQSLALAGLGQSIFGCGSTRSIDECDDDAHIDRKRDQWIRHQSAQRVRASHQQPTESTRLL